MHYHRYLHPQRRGVGVEPEQELLQGYDLSVNDHPIVVNFSVCCVSRIRGRCSLSNPDKECKSGNGHRYLISSYHTGPNVSRYDGTTTHGFLILALIPCKAIERFGLAADLADSL